VGRLRLTWDLIACVCLLVELWVTPFELVFLDADRLPPFLTAFTHAITAFFFLDIVLNFSTGYIEDNKTVMQRCAIARNYLKLWFWLDALATIPFDLILESASSMNGMVRMAKAPKVLKTLRYLRMVETMRLLRMSRQARRRRHANAFLVRYTPAAMLVLLVLALHAHFHGCIWASLQPWPEAEDISTAFNRYYESLWWAHTSLTSGAPRTSTIPSVWTLEMLISTERLIFVALAGVWGVLQAMVYREDEARTTLIKDDAINYLKQHRVSFQTQLQVLNSLKETRSAWNVQRHFYEVVDDFPHELRRKISEEMWAKQLRSLELISIVCSWEYNFMVELALIVQEEMLASQTTVCTEGDACVAAYKIIRGELEVVSSLAIDAIPRFTDGMWVGEKALVNPNLRRSATVWAAVFTTLMRVPADDFQQLLSRFNLLAKFRELCEEQLWGGLCGRCGSFGDHFSDACPLATQGKRSTRIFSSWARSPRVDGNESPSQSLRQSRRPARNSDISLGSDPMDIECARMSVNHFSKPLVHFLHLKHLEWLMPALQQMGISDIDELESMNINNLRLFLASHGEAYRDLSEEEVSAFTESSFQDFQKRMINAGRRVISKGMMHRTHHLMFLSHYKVEAGTEAALMRSELEQLMSEDHGSPGRHFDVPIFLDSEDLTDLTILQERVFHSHNLVLLLTKEVLQRPWVLVEIVTAVRWNIPVLLVTVEKDHNRFTFPDDRFYEKLLEGNLLSSQDMAVLDDCDITLPDAEQAIRGVLKRIAVPYSPHKPTSIRRAELQSLLEEVTLRSDAVG